MCITYVKTVGLFISPVKSQIVPYLDLGQFSWSRNYILGSTKGSWLTAQNLGCNFKCTYNRGEVDPCYLGKFYCAFDNIVNVLGTRRDEELAAHLTLPYHTGKTFYRLALRAQCK